jgi:hypothetical protein
MDGDCCKEFSELDLSPSKPSPTASVAESSRVARLEAELAAATAKIAEITAERDAIEIDHLITKLEKDLFSITTEIGDEINAWNLESSELPRVVDVNSTGSHPTNSDERLYFPKACKWEGFEQNQKMFIRSCKDQIRKKGLVKNYQLGHIVQLLKPTFLLLFTDRISCLECVAQ